MGYRRSGGTVPTSCYSNQRGPARNMTILATSYSDPGTGGVLTHGTGDHEPMAYTIIRYGEGRVFGTAMGHGAPRPFNSRA